MWSDLDAQCGPAQPKRRAKPDIVTDQRLGVTPEGRLPLI
jgi:hypothetical protein